jgi:hypothetical protein
MGGEMGRRRQDVRSRPSSPTRWLRNPTCNGSSARAWARPSRRISPAVQIWLDTTSAVPGSNERPAPAGTPGADFARSPAPRHSRSPEPHPPKYRPFPSKRGKWLLTRSAGNSKWDLFGSANRTTAISVNRLSRNPHPVASVGSRA